MSEKHHPASSKEARVRVTRAMRREDRRVMVPMTTQPVRTVQPTGFFRGAKVKAKG